MVSHDISNPSAFVTFVIQQLLSLDTVERKILVLHILERLKEPSQLLTNTWRKSQHYIVVSDSF